MTNLTPREKQVAFCVSKGLSNKQIAFDLGMAEQTVRNHLSIIYLKKNVRNRTQLAIKEADILREEEQLKRLQEEGFEAFRQVSGRSLYPDSEDEEEE